MTKWMIPDHDLSVEVFQRLNVHQYSSRIINMVREASPEFDTVGELRKDVLGGKVSYRYQMGKKTLGFLEKVVLARVVP